VKLAIRWSGLLLILGSLGTGASIALMSMRPEINQALSPGLAGLMLASATLFLLALPAMQVVQADRAGALGLVAHALLATGLLLLVLVAGLPIADEGFSGAYAENGAFFVFGIALTLGLLLTGVATFRAAVFPRGAGVVILVATAGFFFAFFVAENLPPIWLQIGTSAFAMLLALGFAWVGLALWRHSAS
jgi:hypothetical protein